MKVRIADLRFYDYAIKEYPDLKGEEYEQLLSDIIGRGQLYPILIDQSNLILDGRQRVRVATELGFTEIEAEIKFCDTEFQREEIADVANLLRRHLSKSQRLAKIAKYYLPMKKANLERKKRNLRVGKMTSHKLNEINPSPEKQEPCYSEEIKAKNSVKNRRDEVKEIAKKAGLKISSYEADEVSKVANLAIKENISTDEAVKKLEEADKVAKKDAKESGKTISQVIVEEKEIPDAKTGWMGFDEKCKDIGYRNKVFTLLKEHSTVIEISYAAIYLPGEIKAKLAPRRTYIIQV